MIALPFQPPLDWPGLLRFLRARAIPGVECVDESTYRRGRITISLAPGQRALLVDGAADDALVLRIRHLFDLDADPRAIQRRLGKDRLLSFRPGIRVPGCLDPFELALRAVVGQQISVSAASTFMGRIHSTFGLAPVKLAEADLTTIGLTRSRAETVRSLAAAALNGGLQLDRLREIRGIGPWTVQYIAMRAFKDADAFPAEDLILRRAASSNGQPLSARQLTVRAEVWRPFRAYAVMSLWRAYVDRQST